MVNVCPLCKRVLNEGEECGCISPGAAARQSARSKAFNVIAGTGASTAFFITVLFYTVSVFFNALSSGSSFMGVYGGLLGRLNAAAPLLAEDALLPQLILSLLGLAPSVLICAGLWVLFSESRKKAGSPAGTLRFIKIAVIAQFSLLFILAAVIETAMFTAFLNKKPEFLAPIEGITKGIRKVEALGAILAVIAAAGVLIFYFAGILKAVNTAVRSLYAGERRGSIPPWLIVMNYIFALINLTCAGFEIAGGNAAAAVSAVCAAAFLAGMAASLGAVRHRL
ncbi:MAG: hypothetical protein LBH95_03255 [Oscillospiraceae bacterium]|jgi:hypothetical protein|nr:hypothetical protein [Oscillospiraceae bacterium]